MAEASNTIHGGGIVSLSKKKQIGSKSGPTFCQPTFLFAKIIRTSGKTVHVKEASQHDGKIIDCCLMLNAVTGTLS